MSSLLKLFFSVLITALSSLSAQGAPAYFGKAKQELKQHVYHDRNQVNGEFYCGCNWNWVGKSGGRVDHQSCGYEIRAQKNRAERTEWEHVLPAHSFGHARQCWQKGGRKNCAKNDPVFKAMEADMHNLTVAVGEINADRSNYRFGVLPSTPYQHGQCDFKVDFKQRTVEPRNEVKGQIARIYFYMHDRYDLRMSSQQKKLMMAWNKQYPATEWELERDQRIAKVMGHGNPFVSGQASWLMNHKNAGAGLQTGSAVPALPAANTSDKTTLPIRGNRNSKIYHLSHCPSYNAMAEKNIVAFDSEQVALEAGFRKAKNCP